MRVLGEASSNLFRRTDDEHFESMKAIMEHAEKARDRSFEREVDINDRPRFFWMPDDDGNFCICLADNTLLYPTNFAFRQFAQLAGASPDFFEKVAKQGDVQQAIDLLNTTTYNPQDDRKDQKLFIERDADNEDKFHLRSYNGLDYTRIYDAAVLRQIHEFLLPGGMSPAKPTMNTNANRDNIMGNNKPALFRGESDSFCFFMEDEEPSDDLGGLRVGIMFSNSEVGTKSFSWTTLYFRDICANFLIWGAQDVKRKRVIHRGNVTPKWSEFQADISKMYEELRKRRGDHLTIFAKAKATPFAGDGSPTDANKGIAIQRLTQPKKLKISKRKAEAIIATALHPVNGGDLSYWSIANGITWLAKDTTSAANMVESAKAANYVLESVPS